MIELNSKKLHIKNIIIRGLNDEDRTVINTAMRETGCRQASKAVLKVCHAYHRMLAIYTRQKQEIQLKDRQIADLQAIVNSIRQNQITIQTLLQTEENKNFPSVNKEKITKKG